MKPIPSQGRRLIALLKRKGMTSMELLCTGVSTCWWKRVSEALRPDELLVKRKNNSGLLVYRVVSATRWTA
jgi:hypothetical protein